MDSEYSEFFSLDFVHDTVYDYVLDSLRRGSPAEEVIKALYNEVNQAFLVACQDYGNAD